MKQNTRKKKGGCRTEKIKRSDIYVCICICVCIFKCGTTCMVCVCVLAWACMGSMESQTTEWILMKLCRPDPWLPTMVFHRKKIQKC